MKYLKLFESFERSYWEVEDTEYELVVSWCRTPREKFSDSEIKRIKSLFRFDVSDATNANGGKGFDKSPENFIFNKNEDAGFQIEFGFDRMIGPYALYDFQITKFEDEYFYVLLDFYSQSRQYYKCDGIEGLVVLIKDTLFNNGFIDQDDYKLLGKDRIMESLADDQIEDLSDLFIDVADKYNLIESDSRVGKYHNRTIRNSTGSELGDFGSWRISRLSGHYSELFVQINIDRVDVDKFEEDLSKFLEKVQKLNMRYEKLWWGDIYTYAFYKASRYMIKLS